ncbi:MAG: hypothetical protein CMJ39_04685 [Phycisphaerae bacterium]|nr:hypothetical protein [Phycisphaerae bacterium]|tara:strand:+ start:493 stop:1086 length:594 start_codon:yes stop_codon:yes gene_type:complete
MLMKSITLLMTFTLLLAACDKSSDQTSADSKQTSTAANKPNISSRHFTDERPAEVKNLLEVKKTAQKGDQVVFLARIGGKAGPFLEKKAIFLAADPSLVSCELMGKEDHCQYPEDYCCEDPDKLREGLATIQFVDGRGKPINTSAKGAGGLESLKFIVVSGKVRDRNDDGLFIVDAQEIWVGGKPNRQDHMAGSLSP